MTCPANGNKCQCLPDSIKARACGIVAIETQENMKRHATTACTMAVNGRAEKVDR